MEWDLRYGTEEWTRLFKLIRADTGFPHPAEDSKPALRADCIPYRDAFQYLSACRSWNQVGPMPIPLSEMEAYLRLSGTHWDDPMKFVRLMRLLDATDRQFYFETKAKK